MTSSPALSNDLCHLVDLALRAAEGAESLLGELASTLVFAVAEEFDYAALVGCKTVDTLLSAGDSCNVHRRCMMQTVSWWVLFG